MPFRRPFAVIAALALAVTACGGDDTSSDADASNGDELTLVEDPIMDADEPTVELPSEVPTTLVLTDITVGEGRSAESGDTVFVNYVGVLSADGSRFDGNYGSDPFVVTLGMGMVIPGWDQGLVGMQAGGRRQLDIPADLAYGSQGAGDAIPPDAAISFVVDMIAVVPATDAADEPAVDIAPADNVGELVTTDLIVGDGAVAEAGAKAVLQLVAFRADTAAQITSTWASPQPLSFELTEGGTLPGLVEGIQGMKVGGRRQLQIPFEDAWGAEGQSEIGLPGEIDLIVVIDLLATF